MHKQFIRYFLIVMAVTVLMTVVGNSLIQAAFAERTARETGGTMIRNIAARINGNNEVIRDLTESLNENYITRAHAFAEIIAQDPDMLTDFDEMVRMTELLNVNEVHVTDEKGVLRWGNIQSYYGLDFAATDQTRPFMPGLTDKSFALAQEPQPNGIEGKLFQYISVARQDKPGIVQVGVVPEVLDRALANNRIDVVIANYNVSPGQNVIAIDRATGLVAGDSHQMYIGDSYQELGISEECFTLEKKSDWVENGGHKVYAVFGNFGDYLLAVSFTESYLSAERESQNFVAVVSSILLGLIIIVAVFILLTRVIIRDIEEVNRNLKGITQGDLDITVNAENTPEFVQLSQGINEMVGSLKDHMQEIASQAARLEESNQNILSSLNYARRIQTNLLPSPDAFGRAFDQYSVLWEPKDVVGGDIYWIKNFEQGSVLCVCDCTGHGTPGALLTMLVIAVLEDVVTERTCGKPDEIMWALDQKLTNTLNASDAAVENAADIRDGADMAILCIRNTGEIVLAAANTRLFICDGQTVQDIKGQKISLGGGTLPGRDAIKTVLIPAGANNRYYVASDGLFDQIGGEGGIPFGYRRFKSIVLKNHNLTQQEIMDRIWETFKSYMGDEHRRDDITLLSFRLREQEESEDHGRSI